MLSRVHLVIAKRRISTPMNENVVIVRKRR